MTSTSQPQNEQNNVSVRYSPLFRQYLARALRQSLAHVTAHRYTVPEDVRLQTWHILRLALGVDDLWAQTSELLIELAPRMEMAGLRDDWMPYLEAGIGRSEVLGDAFSLAKIRYFLGQLYRLMGMYDEASSQFDKSEEVFVSLDESNSRAMVLNERGYLSYFNGDYPRTSALAENALSLFDSQHPERAMSHYHLGKVAEGRSDWTAAKKHYQTGLDIRRCEEDQLRVSMNLENLGAVHAGEGHYADAIEQYNNALNSFEQLSVSTQRGSVLNNLGIALRRSRRYDEAASCYLQALEIFKQISDLDGQVSTYNNLSMVYKDLRYWSKATTSAETAIRVHKSLGNMLMAANAMDTLGEVHIARGDLQIGLRTFEEALTYIEGLPKISLSSVYRAIVNNLQKTKARIENTCTVEESRTRINSNES